MYSIWIVHEDDGTYDVSVWDEIENERYEELEVGRLSTEQEAEEEMRKIIAENPNMEFFIKDTERVSQ